MAETGDMLKTSIMFECIMGTSAGSDPGAETESQYTATLKKRWFRVKVDLGGTDPVATCWAVGFLEERQT